MGKFLICQCGRDAGLGMELFRKSSRLGGVLLFNNIKYRITSEETFKFFVDWYLDDNIWPDDNLSRWWAFCRGYYLVIYSCAVPIRSVEQRDKAGTWLCPATQNCTMLKIGSTWVILAGLGGIPRSREYPSSNQHGGSIPVHMVKFARTNCLETWGSGPRLF